MTQTIEILNPNKKIKKPFSLDKPLWLGRSFMAWCYLLLSEACIIIALSSFDKLVSYFEFFFAGLFFTYWLIDFVLQRYQKMFDEMLGMLKYVHEIIERRLQ